MELFQSKELEQKSVQVPQHLQFEDEEKQQQHFTAIQRNSKLMIDSGVILSKICSHSFSKSNYFSHSQQSLHLDQQNNHKKQEQSHDQDDFKEEILLSRQECFENKESLFKTAQHQMHSYYHSSTNTPEKSIIAQTQSSSDIHGDMKISERQINMMKNINFSTERINQEEYESLQCKIYILEQQNSQKNDKIDELSRKITELEHELSRLDRINEQNNIFQVKCKKLQRKLAIKDSQLERLTENFAQLQGQVKKCQKTIENKQEQMYKILIMKQKQIEQLQNQINLLQQQVTREQQKFLKQIQALQSLLHEREIEMHELRAEYDRKYDIYITSIKQMKERINQYELKMQKMQFLIKDKDRKNSQVEEDSCKISIIEEELKQLKQSQESIIDSTESDAKIDSSVELQRTLLIYQNTIKNQLVTIKQLEEKALEFIKDILTKQNEAKLLQSRLFQCQNLINALHVEKLSVELQNKRIKKVIQDCQNKLAILGNRLLKLAKTNSTVSSIERRNSSSLISLQLK